MSTDTRQNKASHKYLEIGASDVTPLNFTSSNVKMTFTTDLPPYRRIDCYSPPSYNESPSRISTFQNIQTNCFLTATRTLKTEHPIMRSMANYIDHSFRNLIWLLTTIFTLVKNPFSCECFCGITIKTLKPISHVAKFDNSTKSKNILLSPRPTLDSRNASSFS